MINPLVTYRIQFHKDFTFASLDNILPYLNKLGIKTIYASPVFEATPGSLHGYDIVNPHSINPEIGTEDELRKLSEKLKTMGMQWIQDIVPNHMAFHPNNLWLMDVLEKGRYSVYANFFDMAWASELFHGSIIVPVLSEPLEDVLQNKEIEILHVNHQFVARYADNAYPLHPRSYRSILQHADAPESIRQFTQQIEELHQVDEPVAYALRWHELLLQLEAQLQTSEIRQYISDSLKKINEDSSLLKSILGEQTYRLTPYQVTDRRITFRRFFTVNELLGINMQDQRVFEHYHRYIKKLIDDDVFQGLRIDHVDGLLDPSSYLDQLRALVGPDVYIIIEKILKPDESLPCWPVQGTTGYEFLAQVTQVMTDTNAEEALTKLYTSITHEHISAKHDILRKKSHILREQMHGEWENLSRLFIESGLVNKSELTLIQEENLKQCLAEFLIQFPVYRYYGNKIPLSPKEQQSLAALFDEIAVASPSLQEASTQMKNALVNIPENDEPTISSRRALFYMRCMQLTGPLMAKGLEDTFFYTYNRFIVHNEVGDDPTSFGMSVESYHQLLVERQHSWPKSLNATATHDTKRGEDVRARLNAMAAVPDAWINVMRSWEKIIATARESGAPDPNDAYFILQTIAGAYPLTSEDDLPERIEAYVIKSLRESKHNSDWNNPDDEYEKFAVQFVRSLLSKTGPFLKSLEEFLLPVVEAGLLNSLIQVVLKFTSPGVPDVYQGCEGWDFSLVDPDNRRPVDFGSRIRALDALCSLDAKQAMEKLWQTRNDGRVKQYLIYKLCQARTEYAALFSDGQYIPLTVKGTYKDYILAFGRKHEGHWIITVVPLFIAALAKGKDVTKLQWKDTVIVLPEGLPSRFKNLIDDNDGAHEGKLDVKKIFASFPLAVLSFKSHPDDRRAGILLHITSLPGPFAVGDFGPKAFEFADFLQRAKQSCWQVLPINPTNKATGHSPYSAFSSMAGNPLLISPELLMTDGLLAEEDIEPFYRTVGSVEYAEATSIRETLFEKAWRNFQRVNDPHQYNTFEEFVRKEAAWVDDFALFVVLKKVNDQQPWNKWPSLFKQRNEQALLTFAAENENEIQKAKWLQFVFDKQWQNLKRYCNNAGIRMVGDLPFYVVYDSVDVWAHPENFSLDDNREVSFMAGVPPDYFNADGQLWGMPVFDWASMKLQGYDWWKKRLKKNTTMFDIVRLDHFRAFAGFWQVATGEQTAVNGEWKKGPGSDFFEEIKKDLGDLPFIAEDLGEITPDVYALRDEFRLPGMKVLQFAFGDDLPYSPYAPHNYTENFVVYTGTHDNNTTSGWFSKDCTPQDRKSIQRYAGVTINKDNVHKILIRLAYASVCNTVIIPMQDLLGIDETARMNTPGTSRNNWLWRIEKMPDEAAVDYMKKLTSLFNRGA